MTWWLIKTIIYQSILLTGSIVGLIYYRRMDKASKIIVLFVSSTFISEAIATFFAVKYHNNIVVFHVYNPIQTVLLSLYFNFSIEKFNKKNIGWIIAGFAVAFSIINSVFIQSIFKVFNSNVLIVESFLVIGMCLYSFYDLLLGDELIEIFSYKRFWYTALLLTFWSFTFCYWLVWHALFESTANNIQWLGVMIWVINVLCYSGFAIVFLSFRKMKHV